MKVGTIGSGGREHALCVSLNKSNLISKYIVYLEMQELALLPKYRYKLK